jgi:hypothetical protein
MTQRLLEMQDYADRDEAVVARLLSAMEPASPNEAAERRVYAKVCARRSPPPRLVRAVVLVVALLVSTAIFSATLARRWLVGMFEKAPHLTAVTQPVGKRSIVPPRLLAELTPTQEVGGVTLPTATAEQNVASPSVAPVEVRRGHTSKTLVARRRTASDGNSHSLAEEAPSADVAAAAPPSEEAVLVLAAVRALRREHDPVRAGALLDDYLKRFPHGVLAEEALAVGIEAAVARLDTRAARLLADKYLGRYPSGRFAGLARKASGRP